jgi:hypothetical protein
MSSIYIVYLASIDSNMLTRANSSYFFKLHIKGSQVGIRSQCNWQYYYYGNLQMLQIKPLLCIINGYIFVLFFYCCLTNYLRLIQCKCSYLFYFGSLDEKSKLCSIFRVSENKNESVIQARF